MIGTSKAHLGPRASLTRFGLIALLVTACQTAIPSPGYPSGLYTPCQTSEVSPGVRDTLPACNLVSTTPGTALDHLYKSVTLTPNPPLTYIYPVPVPIDDMDHSQLSENWEACESANAEIAKLLQDMSELIDEMIIDELSKDRARFERCKAGSYMLHAKDAMQKAKHQMKDAANAMSKERLK